MYFTLYPSDELNLCQLSVIVRCWTVTQLSQVSGVIHTLKNTESVLQILVLKVRLLQISTIAVALKSIAYVTAMRDQNGYACPLHNINQFYFFRGIVHHSCCRGWPSVWGGGFHWRKRLFSWHILVGNQSHSSPIIWNAMVANWYCCSHVTSLL